MPTINASLSTAPAPPATPKGQSRGVGGAKSPDRTRSQNSPDRAAPGLLQGPVPPAHLCSVRPPTTPSPAARARHVTWLPRRLNHTRAHTEHQSVPPVSGCSASQGDPDGQERRLTAGTRGRDGDREPPRDATERPETAELLTAERTGVHPAGPSRPGSSAVSGTMSPCRSSVYTRPLPGTGRGGTGRRRGIPGFHFWKLPRGFSLRLSRRRCLGNNETHDSPRHEMP